MIVSTKLSPVFVATVAAMTFCILLAVAVMALGGSHAMNYIDADIWQLNVILNTAGFLFCMSAGGLIVIAILDAFMKLGGISEFFSWRTLKQFMILTAVIGVVRIAVLAMMGLQPIHENGVFQNQAGIGSALLTFGIAMVTFVVIGRIRRRFK